jgi:membrane fusion protein, copper/silver efflux system
MRKLLVVCVLACLDAFACSSGMNESPSVAEAQPAPLPAGTPAQKLVAAYIGLQQKLAADDAKSAKAGFGQLKAAADAKDLPGDAALKQRISAAAAAGAAAKDIEAERAAFVKASDGMLEWLKTQGNPLTTNVKVAHCPMAQDGKGARWLQTDAKLKNPYFGSEMLECGSIEKEVKPGSKLN